MLKKSQIPIRDPFVLAVHRENHYYLYGTTDKNVWNGKAEGFDVYKSKDLKNWEGPFPAFRPENGFWADENFWAPEVYLYKGKYYMFASFKSKARRRGTQILVSSHPEGPFTPLTETPVTPEEWECLDGTLYIDKQNNPWIIFSHEWVQVRDGEICAQRLAKDLRRACDEPMVLFRASEANWPVWVHSEGNYVTDGPFLYENNLGEIVMLWSSEGDSGYAIGQARSKSGNITGPWTQEDNLLFKENGGHGMLFTTFDNQLMLAIHRPNITPQERPEFIPVKEERGLLTV